MSVFVAGFGYLLEKLVLPEYILPIRNLMPAEGFRCLNESPTAPPSIPDIRKIMLSTFDFANIQIIFNKKERKGKKE